MPPQSVPVGAGQGLLQGHMNPSERYQQYIAISGDLPRGAEGGDSSPPLAETITELVIIILVIKNEYKREELGWNFSP